MQHKEVLEEVLANLRCIDTTGNAQIESYIDDSIKIIKEALEGTAQEVLVQEQCVGKCEYCGYDNKFKLPIGKKLPDGVEPKFCTQCGKEIKYSKMVNQKYLQEDAK